MKKNARYEAYLALKASLPVVTPEQREAHQKVREERRTVQTPTVQTPTVQTPTVQATPLLFRRQLSPDWEPNIERVVLAASPRGLTCKEISDILTKENSGRWGPQPGRETPWATIAAAAPNISTIRVDSSKYPFTWHKK